MPVILQHGTPVSARSIEERLSGPVFDDLVVIVPTRRRIRYLVREVMAMTGKPVTPAFPFFTLETFARSLYAASETPARVVGGAVQTLLFQAAIRKRRDQLEYFIPRKENDRLFRGTLEKLIDVILRLKETGVRPATLREEAEMAPLDERRKLVDVAEIYEGYNESLRELGAIDGEGIFEYFSREYPAESFRRLFRFLYPGVDLVSLAGFDEFTPPEIGILEACTRVPGLAVRLLFDYQHGNPALFGHLEGNYRRFVELGFREVPESAPVSKALFPINTMSRSMSSRRAADILARSLFRSVEGETKPDLRKSVTIMAAAGRRQEVTLICRLIKSLAADDPALDLGTVCVATLQPQLYTDLFREESARFGIPVNITDRYHLSRSPLVAQIFALLRTPLRGFRRDDVLRLARTPYFTFLGDVAGLDAGALARVSARLRVTVGEDSWTQKIGKDRESLRKSLGQAGDARDRRRQERALMLLGRAESSFDALRETMSGMKGRCTPREFYRRVVALLSRARVARNIVKGSSEFSSDAIERDARAFTKFLEVLDESTRLAEFEFGPDASLAVDIHIERLATAVSRERYNVHEQFGRGVLVTSIDETRGLSMNVMIVAGLVDGEFPSVYQPEVFLSGVRRKERERRSLWQNRYLFYQAITNWTGHLYLTYPRRDGEVDLVPSSFIDALQASVDVEEWQGDTEVPFGEILASEDDALRWCAGHPGAVLPLAGTDRQFLSKKDEVLHAARVEGLRATDQGLPPYGGILQTDLSDAARDRLAGFAQRVYSVSQLETYRKCPFQFFAGRVLQLDAAEELEESLTPLEKGSVLHDALFQFYLRRREMHLPPIAGCSDDEFSRAVSDLTTCVEERLNRLDVPDVFWQLERENLLGRPGSDLGLVREFLEFERNRKEESTARFFEVAFGDLGSEAIERDPDLSNSEVLTIGNVRVRGKIDRIEVGDGFFAIIDYKTGAVVPKIDEILEGTSLQLPVYLLAAETLVSRASGKSMTPAAGLYYLLRRPVRLTPGLGLARYNKIAFRAGATSRQVVQNDLELRRILEGAVEAVNASVRGITEGRFPLVDPDRSEDICQYCKFSTVCRIQIARHVQRISPEGI